MALSAFNRLTDRILARLGEDAVLRTAEGCRVNIEHNVEVAGNEGQMVYSRSVATMLKSLKPRIDDPLVFVDAAGIPIPGQAYAIDSPPFEENGYTARYILRSV